MLNRLNGLATLMNIEVTCSIQSYHEHSYTHCVFKLYESCEISSSHGGEYEVQNCLLGCTAVYVGRQLFYTAVHPRRQF
jgi:hypothetical protein